MSGYYLMMTYQDIGQGKYQVIPVITAEPASPKTDELLDWLQVENLLKNIADGNFEEYPILAMLLNQLNSHISFLAERYFSGESQKSAAGSILRHMLQGSNTLLLFEGDNEDAVRIRDQPNNKARLKHSANAVLEVLPVFKQAVLILCKEENSTCQIHLRELLRSITQLVDKRIKTSLQFSNKIDSKAFMVGEPGDQLTWRYLFILLIDVVVINSLKYGAVELTINVAHKDGKVKITIQTKNEGKDKPVVSTKQGTSDLKTAGFQVKSSQKNDKFSISLSISAQIVWES